jgi:protein transport protein SEC31
LQLPSADNWAFQVDWCPRNPDLFAAAFFDGTVGIHSIQSTNEPSIAPEPAAAADAADVFDSTGYTRANQATLSLKQPPKWLRRPTSNAFGYGGKLVTVSNLPAASGKHQSAVVHIRTVVTEETIVERATKLQTAVESDTLVALAEEKGAEEPSEASAGWRALLSLFKANSRNELITLLGFSKEEVAARVAEAVEKLKEATGNDVDGSPTELDVTEGDLATRETVVSFVEPEREITPEEDEETEETDANALAAETTPSEVSTGAASDATHHADGESTTTAPSLFGDEIAGTPQIDAAADFFGSIGTSRSDEPQLEIPHHNYPVDSSVAATIGSRPSSVASEALKNNTFRIYPNDESETDQLVTKALVLGDFESAVSLCLSCERFADAILLAVRGGPELLQRTQKTYFERRTTELPYLRLFQSIVTDDLEDIVQNADLQEWQEIFVVLCTFASQEDFANLAEQLGQRLEFQASLAKASANPDAADKAQEFRKNATLTYLAAGRLERLVNIWIEELSEEESCLLQEETLHGSRYTAHAYALQTFIEKVTVFRKAIKYDDTDLVQHTSPEVEEARSYKLSSLYDRYFEYADLLAAQGLVKEALSFLKLTPSTYHGAPGTHLDFTEGRKRLQVAAGASATPVSTSSIPGPSAAAPKVSPVASNTSTLGYGGQYGVPSQAQQPFVPQQPAATPASSAYTPYGGAPAYGAPTASNPYAPPVPLAAPNQQGYQPPAPSYGSGPYGQPAPQAPAAFPPPRGGTPSAPLAPPPKGPAVKRDNGGWNDVPVHVAARRTPANSSAAKLSAITSPFPNAPSPSLLPPPTPPAHGQPPSMLPPPPRPGSVQQRPPPPPQGQRLPPPPQQGSGPYPPQQGMMPPPPQMMPPPQGPGLARGPPPPQGQFSMPPPRGHVPQQTPPMAPSHLPPGPPPMRATPSPNFARGTPPPGQPGPYAPPPQQGGFAPPPPQQGGFAPPPQQGSFAPPQGVARPPPGAGQAPPMGPPQGSGQGQSAPSAPPPRAKPGPPQPKYRTYRLLVL